MSCMTSEKGLELEEAIRLLENVEEYTTINQPPIKPKGGEVFLYLPFSQDEQDNYKCDQYRWLNSGPKEIPRKNPLVKKQYFIGKLPQGKTQAFQKHCYILVDEQRSPYPVLLHYIGDETVMVDYPHGNAKKSSSAYYATAPSVRKDIANRSKTAMPTQIINSFKTVPDSPVISNEGEVKDVNPVLTPRNKSQIRNIRRKQKISNKKEGAVKHEDLVTLHSLGTELVGFTHYVSTHPEFACIVGLNDFAVEIESLLKLTNNMLVFTFHECYKVGRYYVTPFNFIHVTFTELPTIPCFFLLSDTCDFFNYRKLLQTALDNIPSLEGISTVVLTNQEYIFTTALSMTFPNWTHVYDWEILLGVARTFLRKLNLDVKDISLRIKQLKALMSSETLEDYRTELERLKKDWPMSFCDYYLQVLREPVETKLGRWLLERYKLFHPHTGILRGSNPELQLIIKHLQDIKELSLDVILPSLYHLQVYLYASIQKSFCKSGRYKLATSFKFLQRDADELMLPSKIYEPAQIVNIFRVRGITLFSENGEIGEDEDNNSLLQARRIVEMDNISHSTALKAFLVKSTTGSLHGVQLFPRESCSCSINQRCSHIMAVMMALGMPVVYDRKGTVKVVKPPQPGQSDQNNDLFMEMVAERIQMVQDEQELVNNVMETDRKSGQVSQPVSIPVHEIQQPTSTTEAVSDNSTADVSSVILTGLYPQQSDGAAGGIVHMDASELQNLVHGSVFQREDGVFMVVTDGSTDNNGKLSIAYEAPKETIVFNQPPQQQQQQQDEQLNTAETSSQNNDTLSQSSEDITQPLMIDETIIDDVNEPVAKKACPTVENSNLGTKGDKEPSIPGVEVKPEGNKTSDMPPVELILNMSELMHKSNTN